MTSPDPSRFAYASLPVAIPSAGVLFFDPSGKVLLLRTTYKKGWEIPGGVIETAVGETPLQAAHREVAEELGITPPIGRLLTIDAVPRGDRRPALLAFVFDGGVLDAAEVARIRFVDKEIAEATFCGLEQIQTLLVPRLARRVLSSMTARGDDDPNPVYLHDGLSI